MEDIPALLCVYCNNYHNSRGHIQFCRRYKHVSINSMHLSLSPNNYVIRAIKEFKSVSTGIKVTVPVSTCKCIGKTKTILTLYQIAKPYKCNICNHTCEPFLKLSNYVKNE